MTERGADFDAKREAYEASEAELIRLIDYPDRTLTVREYQEKLKAALHAKRKAHKAMMGAWVCMSIK